MELTSQYRDLLQNKANIEHNLRVLPQGYISHKTIKGKSYAYLQNKVAGKMVSTYLKLEDEAVVSEQLIMRKQYEDELIQVNRKIFDIESVAALDKEIGRTLMLIKISTGMDEIDSHQKAKSISFAYAMNAIEGVPITAQAAQDILDWKNGSKSFLSIFEGTLKRYGFL